MNRAFVLAYVSTSYSGLDKSPSAPEGVTLVGAVKTVPCGLATSMKSELSPLGGRLCKESNIAERRKGWAGDMGNGSRVGPRGAAMPLFLVVAHLERHLYTHTLTQMLLAAVLAHSTHEVVIPRDRPVGLPIAAPRWCSAGKMHLTAQQTSPFPISPAHGCR